MAQSTYNARVLVLRKTKLGESDLILSLLAQDGSQIRAVAKGARKPTSQFSSRLELYSQADVLLAQGRTLEIVKEARLIAGNAALRDVVAADDEKRMATVPGVGKKTASRIILELKGSLDHVGETLFSKGEDSGADANDTAAAAAREALLAMGFTSAEADLALKGAPEGASEKGLLQFALKKLGSA